ncbi:hypothetical protein PC110_g3373 [Phytophthora cactorum]|uniref:Uncharacterized protein n=1 Tax=Phytophthora cactorum TaxID=29920 RepID=A0A329SX25_9STRA|nr:hypothetical protein PC110_g3373 [Phytophthora cactorum]
MNCYGWVEWTVKANLHLMFCENALARRYTNLEPISVETLSATMEGVTLLVEAAIGDELPDGFDLMLDGWSHASEHYVAVFAWYEPDGLPKKCFIACHLSSMSQMKTSLHALTATFWQGCWNATSGNSWAAGSTWSETTVLLCLARVP